jgi:hypothetical protein
MAKLTLSVDAAVVRRAKRYAARQGTSLSRLVERYLSLLSPPRRPSGEPDPPILARLRGALKGSSAGVEDYKRHLERRYR